MAAKVRDKRRSKFPLYQTSNGMWAKTINGTREHFHSVRNDPTGERSLAWYREDCVALHSGRPVRRYGAFTVEDAVNEYLHSQKQRCDNGELAVQSFKDCRSACRVVGASLGKKVLVASLGPRDFERMRKKVAEGRGLKRQEKIIKATKTVFNFAYQSDLIELPVKFGPTFKPPSKSALRREKKAKPRSKLTADVVRTIVADAPAMVKAWTLLGLNAGYLGCDISALEWSSIQACEAISGVKIDAPRHKTFIDRLAILWPETVAAIEACRELRPKANSPHLQDRLFLHSDGGELQNESRWHVTRQFTKYLRDSNLAQPGRTFKGLRTTALTIGEGCGDQMAAKLLMGHGDHTVTELYREGVQRAEERVKRVTDEIRQWLFATSFNTTTSGNLR